MPRPPPPLLAVGDAVDVGVVVAINCRLPSRGGMTSVGSRAMRVTPDIVVLIICGLLKPTVSTWIFEGVSSRELDEVRDIGRKAKVEFVKKVVGETDHLKRNSYYLDGLEKCNNIERNWTDSVQDDAFRHGNVTNAVWLQKAGMKEFTALFMTLPPYHMERIAKAACAKHEKQLTCGAEYEGIEVTMKRVAELKKIGNHKMMFEKECKDKDFIKRVYPCVGHDVSKWIEPCSEQVNTYSTLRDSVNQRIADTYDNAVKKVKATTGDDRREDLKIFEKAMSSIAFLEGSKCGLFREMRVCVLRQLLEHCGVEAMKAFNTSISLGYLRTERRERLNLDFELSGPPKLYWPMMGPAVCSALENHFVDLTGNHSTVAINMPLIVK